MKAKIRQPKPVMFNNQSLQLVPPTELEDSTVIYVGFSGGPDSTALLLLLADQFPGRVRAVHFEHGLRPMDDPRETRWCDRFCTTPPANRAPIPLQTVELNCPASRLPGESIEACARRMRLTYWSRFKNTPHLVALGHHQEDRYENFFLRLMRGSNSNGLTSLKEMTSVNGVTFWRPLLKVNPNQLLDFLNQEKVTDFCIDPSNHSTDYRRNAIRHHLMPVFREIAEGAGGLDFSLKHLTEEAEFLEQWCLNFLKEHPLDLNRIKEIPTAMLPRCFKIWYIQQTGSPPLLPHHFYERLKHELNRPVSHERQIPISSHQSLLINHQGWQLLELNLNDDPSPTSPEIDLQVGVKTKFNEWLFLVAEQTDQPALQLWPVSSEELPIHLRYFQPGDQMVLKNGMKRKLKKLFNDHKIPPSQRSNWPIVCNAKGEIIALPELNHRKPLENNDTKKKLFLYAFKDRTLPISKKHL